MHLLHEVILYWKEVPNSVFDPIVVYLYLTRGKETNPQYPVPCSYDIHQLDPLLATDC